MGRQDKPSPAGPRAPADEAPDWRTEDHGPHRGPPSAAVRRFLTVLDGGSGPSGHAWQSSADRCSIGSHASNDLALDEGAVSQRRP
jgi:two-component system, NtrC family, response regulator GlrR